MDECGFRHDPSRVRRLGLPSDYPSVNVLGYIPLFDGFPVFMSFSSNFSQYFSIFCIDKIPSAVATIMKKTISKRYIKDIIYILSKCTRNDTHG